MLYNVALRTGRNLERGRRARGGAAPEHRRRQAGRGGLDLDTLELLAGAPDDFAVLGGEDPLLFPLVLHGRRPARSARRRTSAPSGSSR